MLAFRLKNTDKVSYEPFGVVSGTTSIAIKTMDVVGVVPFGSKKSRDIDLGMKEWRDNGSTPITRSLNLPAMSLVPKYSVQLVSMPDTVDVPSLLESLMESCSKD